MYRPVKCNIALLPPCLHWGRGFPTCTLTSLVVRSVRHGSTVLSVWLGVTDMITFHGIAASHHDLSVYYRQADIFMLLSENQPNGDVEGFGIVALEANFFGLPVIGALHCGVEDAVDHGKSGFLVDGNDATDILRSVESCMENREELSAYAKTWALRHEWDHIVHQFMNVLK